MLQVYAVYRNKNYYCASKNIATERFTIEFESVRSLYIWMYNTDPELKLFACKVKSITRKLQIE